MTRFDAEPVLSGLMGFQRDTVEHIIDRFYGDDPTDRFLTADETGLGKSMVARGVVAKVIERLQDDETVDRIDVVYVCSNQAIAHQNLSRLNVTGDEHRSITSRLSLLALEGTRFDATTKVASKPVNLVAFTPGTSFAVGHTTGRSTERALLHVLLTDLLELDRTQQRASRLLLRHYVGAESFSQRVDAVRHRLGEGVDPVIATAFRKGLGRGGLRARFLGKLEQLKGKHASTVDADRSTFAPLIGELRALLAKASVETLEPDLVILDEFQRFRDLLEPDSGGAAAELADGLFRYGNAKVLLLSATPYKPFTYAEEPGEDHATDFLRTMRFLTDGRTEDLDRLRTGLATFRKQVLSGRDPSAVTAELRTLLLRNLSRVERPQGLTESMTEEHLAPARAVATEDLIAFAGLHSLAAHLEAPMTIEYWKSAPYFANFLDGYRFGERLRDALRAGQDTRIAELIERTATLDRSAIAEHADLDLGNAKLRHLASETVDAGWWRYLWVPPSMPYVEPGGVFADPAASSITKRLIFSSWAAAPTAIASLLSHRASARVDGGPHIGADGQRVQLSPRLHYTASERLSGLPTLALFSPNPTLAETCDPAPVAAEFEHCPPRVTVEAALTDAVRGQVGPDGGARGNQADQAYWEALFGQPGAFPPDLRDHPLQIVQALSGAIADDPEADTQQRSGLTQHVEAALTFTDDRTATRPIDLVDTITAIGLYGPANVAWRALRRRIGDDSSIDGTTIWKAAAVIASGFRTLFNRPETIALIDQLQGRGDEGAYWRHVLSYCADGNLEALLDEVLYVEGCVEAKAFDTDEELLALAGRVHDALALRPAVYQAFDPGEPTDNIRFTSRFALRYASRDDAESSRLPEIRRAFNSPFWPFVLATTSAGQEGIDFHWWCHGIVHWNTPASPVDFEQREGRIHRYGGHAIRKNVAQRYGDEVRRDPSPRPWERAFDLAIGDRPDGDELWPHWVFPGPAKIERHLLPYPLSSDLARLDRLKNDVALYRLTFGQPRQEDLMVLLRRQAEEENGLDVNTYRIDLRPPRRKL